MKRKPRQKSREDGKQKRTIGTIGDAIPMIMTIRRTKQW